VDIVNDSINLMNTRQMLENAKRDLNVVINDNLERQFEVDTNITFVPQIQVEAYVNTAEENNVSLLQAQKNITISDYDYKASKAIFLPSIGLTGSYGWNEGNFPTTSFATSSTTTGVSGGVSLTWDLFDGGRGITTMKNARIQYDNQQLVKDQIKKEVTRDIFNARGNYQNRLKILELQMKNILTARNNFERSSEQYKLGQITSVELRQAQVNLLNAQTSKNLAKYDAKIAELQLLQLTGQLLNIEF
jgi:outer membrane protein TolC